MVQRCSFFAFRRLSAFPERILVGIDQAAPSCEVSGSHECAASVPTVGIQHGRRDALVDVPRQHAREEQGYEDAEHDAGRASTS